MRVAIVTLFPELFSPFLQTSFVGRAQERGLLSVQLVALRDFGLGVHRSVDDTPYGGGSGMVMRADCVVAALEAIDESWGEARGAHRVLLTPQGARFSQPAAERLSRVDSVALICGRYEGFDERIRAEVAEEISLGDFVLTGGEVAAMAVVESCVRLLPGVLGNEASSREESFSTVWGGGLEYPQYTRPRSFRGREVPAVLLSGDHAKIAAWRRAEGRCRTKVRRPDLMDDAEGEES